MFTLLSLAKLTVLFQSKKLPIGYPRAIESRRSSTC